ncbi:MAG: homocysteine S-methyltransferase family protein [Chloroflexi bacterium]|nr:homocysteine S-methyltransferase family protein [Chloroflexota bacterium]MBI4507811.1 homocysteine S-methyltransferase family protein [Chloroflexota bacterium]
MSYTADYEPLRGRLERGRVVLLDGAIGTEILRRDVTWADHQLKKRPDVVRAIHADYIAAGADVISTNTFQLTRRSFLNHFKDLAHMRHIGTPDLETRWAELLRAGVKLAQEARAQTAGGRPVAIAGAMTTLEWCFRPDLAPPADQARAEYREVIEVFADAGCDLLLIETVNSVGEAVAAAEAARQVGIPFWIAFVCDERGRLFTGETLADAARALAPLEPDALLLNCAPPPDVTAGLRELLPHWRGAAGIYPHVGRYDPPEWLFTDEYPPERYAEVGRAWVDLGARVVGGCCGTTPEHIARLGGALATAR